MAFYNIFLAQAYVELQLQIQIPYGGSCMDQDSTVMI